MTVPTIHASAVLVGHRGILIRGPSGSGKSRLALALLQSAGAGFARLVGDDRIHLEAVHGRLLDAAGDGAAGDRNSRPWHPSHVPMSRWRWRISWSTSTQRTRRGLTRPPWR
jgi:hypothetical protein